MNTNAMPPRLNSRRLPTLTAILCATVAASGCYDQILIPDTDTDGRVTVTNDEDALSERLQYTDESVPIDAPAPGLFGGSSSGPMFAPSAVDLTLIAELTPPTVDGQVVQATALSRRSRDAVLVSYNVRGNEFLGGVDYLINWFARFPRIISAVGFGDSDVSAVALDGASIFAAQATDASGFATSAAVERLGLSWFGIRLEDNSRVDLSSFAATSVVAVGSEIYVTTGDDGHVYALDAGDLSVVGQFQLDDARWVAHDEVGGRVIVAQGTPGRISVFQEGSFPGGSMTLLNTFPFPGADVPESKSAIDIAGGKAFIAAGPEGVQVMCLDNGQLVGNVPRPDPASLGLDPSVVVTNAVTVDDDLMFISNGEAGVYVAAGADAWEDTACDAPQSISVMGQLQFGALESVNHVDYRSGFLFVAAGLGGVKIVQVSVTP